jgi:hypothetical protein
LVEFRIDSSFSWNQKKQDVKFVATGNFEGKAKKKVFEPSRFVCGMFSILLHELQSLGEDSKS